MAKIVLNIDENAILDLVMSKTGFDVRSGTDECSVELKYGPSGKMLYGHSVEVTFRVGLLHDEYNDFIKSQVGKL